MAASGELDRAFLESRLPAYLALAFKAEAVILRQARRLSGGAIQENWWLSIDVTGGPRAGALDLVLRTDAPSGVATSRSRADEFGLLRAAFRASVRVPEPILLEADTGLLGRPFFLCSALAGSALGPRIVREWGTDEGRRMALLRELARQLGLIHGIRPDVLPDGLLGPRPDDVIGPLIAGYRRDLDQVSRPSLVVEFALRRLEQARPQPHPPCLCHRDYRTGNYMVDAHGLTGILDWEFAGWSDPNEDLGWFCSKTWRFGADKRPAGGLGTREEFFAAYEAGTGLAVDADSVLWWELMANVRWAVIAHQQADRLLVGGERSLDLALIGRRIHETEREILTMLHTGERFAAA